MKELILSVKRDTWRGTDKETEKADTEFSRVRDRVLRRDKKTCKYCNFRAEKFQEVHHVNDDHTDNSETNLITVCPLCHQVFHIGLAGAQGGGQIIYLPEISQEYLNNIVRAIWVSRIVKEEPYYSDADILYEKLKSRSDDVERIIGTGSSDPAFFGEILLSLDDDAYKKSVNITKNLRLLPLPTRFTKQIPFWNKTVYKGLPPKVWDNLLEKIN